MSTPTSREEKISTCLAKHPDWEDARISNALTVPIALVRAVRGTGPELPAQAPKPPALTGGQKVGLTKAEFMAQHDPTTRTRNMITAAVKLIKPGHFIKDYELRKLAGCGDTGLWHAVASDPEEGFRKYRFLLDSTVWWTDAKSRGEMLATNPKAKEA